MSASRKLRLENLSWTTSWEKTRDINKRSRRYTVKTDIRHLRGTIALCYNNIGNLLPSGDTTILVKNMTTYY